MNRIPFRLAGALVGVSLLAAACGAPKGAGTKGAVVASTTTTLAPGNVDASDYRASLTALLQEHVFLTGLATGAVASGGNPAAPLATLERNTASLQQRITSVFGSADGAQFGDLWRKHIGFFIDYAKAKAGGNQAGADAAKANLTAYETDFGSFLDSATNGNLQQPGAIAELKPHVDTLIATIDSQAAKKANQFDNLKKAADHMLGTAEVLVAAAEKAKPAAFEGDATTGKALLRSTLTAALQEHVYLAGIATSAVLDPPAPPATAADAAAALDKNSVDLANIVGSAYGDPAVQQFLALWRKHIGFFVDYAKARAAKDQSGVSTAKANLDGYRDDFGAFLESATKGRLTKGAVASDLAVHVSGLEAAIDAQAANDPSQFDKLSTAAAHMAMTADMITGALSEQFPDHFSG